MTDPALRCSAALPACAVSFLVLASAGPADAADCALEPQGEGRVAAVIDARSFRLDDGREVRLAGIERAGTDRASGRAALSAIAGGRDVTLHGEDDTPDRYGRQAAFVFVAGSEHSVQSELLRRGEALVSSRYIRQKLRCGTGRRRGARRGDAKLGIWAQRHGHKKRGKSGRYSGRDWAIYGGRGQSSVRSAGGGNRPT